MTLRALQAGRIIASVQLSPPSLKRNPFRARGSVFPGNGIHVSPLDRASHERRSPTGRRQRHPRARSLHYSGLNLPLSVTILLRF